MSGLNYHNTGIQIVLFLSIFKNVAGQFFVILVAQHTELGLISFLDFSQVATRTRGGEVGSHRGVEPF